MLKIGLITIAVLAVIALFIFAYDHMYWVIYATSVAICLLPIALIVKVLYVNKTGALWLIIPVIVLVVSSQVLILNTLIMTEGYGRGPEGYVWYDIMKMYRYPDKSDLDSVSRYYDDFILIEQDKALHNIKRYCDLAVARHGTVQANGIKTNGDGLSIVLPHYDVIIRDSLYPNLSMAEYTRLVSCYECYDPDASKSHQDLKEKMIRVYLQDKTDFAIISKVVSGSWWDYCFAMIALHIFIFSIVWTANHEYEKIK